MTQIAAQQQQFMQQVSGTGDVSYSQGRRKVSRLYVRFRIFGNHGLQCVGICNKQSEFESKSCQMNFVVTKL